MIKVMSDTEKSVPVEQFFEALFGKYLSQSKGYIETRDLLKGRKGIQLFHKTIDELLSYQPQGNLYFGVCPREIKSGKEKDIKTIIALWVDLDCDEGITQEQGFDRLKQFKFKPSIIVDSGNGLHAYWLLKIPELVNPDTKGILKGLARTLGADSCFDLPRILRVPGTKNYKDPNNPKDVAVISLEADLRYSLSDFIQFKTAVQDIPTDKVIFSGQVKDIKVKDLKISGEIKALILNGKQVGDHYPSRSEAEWKVVNELIRTGYSDDDILAVFEHYPIGQKHREQEGYLKYTIAKARQALPQNKNVQADRSNIEELTDDQDFNSVKVAEKIINDHKIIYCAGTFFEYTDGYYLCIAEEKIRRWLLDLVGKRLKMGKAKEIIYFIQSKTHIEPDQLNNTDYLNLKNGLFDLATFMLYPHNPNVYSTIRLNVSYNPVAKCDKWLETLIEIFEEAKDSIELLQEFFGLCFTKETGYEKALLCLGEGANGKSTVLYVLEKMLGEGNCCAVPLERFDNNHYTAELFNKLVNISFETNAKSGVYDSIFKSVISGDSITADVKYQDPFVFRPFCKLIFAVNNMPHVEDRTEAFFRRLLILSFDRVFSEKEQNKKLKYELEEELDGIFLWCLEGLKRLKGRGRFYISDKTQKAIDEYRRENNSVIIFVEEQCILQPDAEVEKSDLYQSYSRWCKDSGSMPLSNIKFGKELKRQYKSVEGSRITGGTRTWKGISGEYISKSEMADMAHRYGR